MGDLERVLKRRPANVVAKFGAASKVAVVDPGRVKEALGEKRVPLLCVPVASAAAIPGVLRAARELDAAIGLSCPFSFEDPHDPAAFVDAVAAEAEERHRQPLFLQAGPVRLTRVGPQTVENALETATRFVKAGFTLLSFDATALGVANNVRVSGEIGRALEDAALLELAAPRGPTGRTSPEGLAHFLKSLDKEKVRPRFVRIDAAVSEGDEESALVLDLTLLSDLQTVAAEHKVGLTVTERGRRSSQLSDWAEWGATKIDAEQAFARIVLQMLPSSAREELAAKARAERLTLASLVGPSEGVVAEMEAGAKDRIEAFSYAEASDLIQAVGAQKSGTAVATFIADHP